MTERCVFFTTYTTFLNRTLFDDQAEDGVSGDHDEGADSDEDSEDSAGEDEDDYHNNVHHMHSRHANKFPEAGEGSLTEQARQRFKSRAALIQAHKQRVVPELREEDLEEMFVRGSGPGGQATNKVSEARENVFASCLI